MDIQLLDRINEKIIQSIPPLETLPNVLMECIIRELEGNKLRSGDLIPILFKVPDAYLKYGKRECITTLCEFMSSQFLTYNKYTNFNMCTCQAKPYRVPYIQQLYTEEAVKKLCQVNYVIPYESNDNGFMIHCNCEDKAIENCNAIAIGFFKK